MKTKFNSGIAACALVLLLLAGCTPEIVDNRLHIRTFFTMQNAAVSCELAYKNGVESALNDFSSLAENVYYENISNINKDNIKNYTNEAGFFVNVGTLDDGLQTEIRSSNLMPSLFSSLVIKDAQYSGEFNQFDINPNLINEAKLIANSIPKNVYIVYSNDDLFKKMTKAFLENYPEEDLSGTMLLPHKSNEFREIVNEILNKDFAVLLLLTSAYDFTNLIYQLSKTTSEKDVYLPSWGERFFVVPPNYLEASFNTFIFDYNYRLLLKNEDLPKKSDFKYSERDYSYFIDGYSATHLLLKSYENSRGNTEFINNMHTAYEGRNLTGKFISFL